MLFPSLVFLFAFLPLVLLLYYILPKNRRNVLLLFFSIVFYAWGGVSYTLILICSILLNYLFVKQIEKNTHHKKQWLSIGLIVNISIIFVFKYLDFFILNINELAFLFDHSVKQIPEANIILPVGISFFTFQQMSLLWDVYRNPEVKKIKFFDTALYISFFPQLIAGPIVRYNDIIAQIQSRKETVKLFNSGAQRFIFGLFKKVIIANTCAGIADSIIDNNFHDISSPVAWLGIIAYAFQIYFDFSGYSDMAIGLGRMFGFHILENFNFPYISKSIKEFWRRWHISLSTWFRDYVYIPIGGNRKGLNRTYVNLFIVFLLTGFWHGATWSFIFWGMFHGLFLVIERLGFDKILKRVPRIIRWSYTMIVVLVGWVFFRVEHISEAFYYVTRMFNGGLLADVTIYDYLNRENMLILILALIMSTPVLKKIGVELIKFSNGRFRIPYTIISAIALMAMFACSVMYINSGSYNPFIYFRF